MFHRNAERWLVALADPRGASPRLPERPLKAGELPRLWSLAGAHGVLPAVFGNLRSLAAAEGAERVAAGLPGGGTPAERLDAALEAPRRMLLIRTGRSLAIRGQTAELAGALAAGGVAATILKGVDFADRLYPDPALRGFGDVDVLVPKAGMEEARGVLEGLGYLPRQVGMKYNAGYGQMCMVRDGAAGEVELHWNLVNSPTMRRGISVELGDLELLPDAAWPLPRPSANSLLLIAAVHAAAGHCMDTLQVLCDVCQAARAPAGPIDAARLAETIRRTGGGLAAAAALDLAGRLLAEPACGELAGRLGLPSAGLWRPLITEGVVLRAHAYRDSFRRMLFRQMLKRPR